MVADYITETGIQTSISKEGICNRRNVFGERYEFKSILDSSNSTFEMDASSAKLVLPANLLRNAEVETHGATFRSIPTVMAKFGISHDDRIASPAVEYFLTGYPELPDHAVCILPFIGGRKDLRVWKFQSDEGMHETIESQAVPEKGKEHTDADLYYIVKGRLVYIYTKSFAGFYCTTCGKRELSLRAYVFGSYKKIQNYEIRLVVYIADEILKFMDYSKRMFDNEYNQGRVQKLDQPINLLPELTENDLLLLRFSPTGVHREGWWEHKLHPVDNMPLKAEEQEIPLSRVEKCHVLSEMPYFVEWYLICTRDDPDFTFQCVVDVDCQTHDNSACVESTVLVVDELQLRSQDLPGQMSISSMDVTGSRALTEVLSSSGASSTDMLESSNYKGNMVADYITETGTQTCIRKEFNRRNVFGEPYEFKSILDSSNSMFEMDASSAKLVLPAKLLRNAKVETHGATFRSIPDVMAKFGISQDDKIASPTVEYFLTEYPVLPDHAVCILPFIGRREDLRVWKFQSDEGMHETIASQTVPEKGKENADADLYYIVKDRQVDIYTKSFSGFYCTTCGRGVLSLRAYVFGSYKKIQNFEIRLVVYIADEILRFKDYSKRMRDIEYNEGRVPKLDQPINLLPDLTNNDLLRLRIPPTGVHGEGLWEHKRHPVENRPIRAAEQEIPLSWVVTCHGHSEMPHFVEWYLICTRDDPDFTFQCLVDVDCQKQDNSACVNTPLVVDELQLRSQDLPGQYEGNAPVRLQDIKHELSRLDDDQRSRLAAKLREHIPFSRETENLSMVLDELQNYCKSNGFLKTIASSLHCLNFYPVLDRLCDVGLIPPDCYRGLPVQPVTRDA